MLVQIGHCLQNCIANVVTQQSNNNIFTYYIIPLSKQVENSKRSEAEETKLMHLNFAEKKKEMPV
jgi:hypothetical protein